jgi:hypothetical protein
MATKAQYSSREMFNHLTDLSFQYKVKMEQRARYVSITHLLNANI